MLCFGHDHGASAEIPAHEAILLPNIGEYDSFLIEQMSRHPSLSLLIIYVFNLKVSHILELDFQAGAFHIAAIIAQSKDVFNKNQTRHCGEKKGRQAEAAPQTSSDEDSYAAAMVIVRQQYSNHCEPPVLLTTTFMGLTPNVEIVMESPESKAISSPVTVE